MTATSTGLRLSWDRQTQKWNQKTVALETEVIGVGKSDITLGRLLGACSEKRVEVAAGTPFSVS